MPIDLPYFGPVLVPGDAPTVKQHEYRATEARGLRERIGALEDRLHQDEGESVQTRKVYEVWSKGVDQALKVLDSRVSAIEGRLELLEERIATLTKKTNGAEFEKEVEAMFSRQFARAKEVFGSLERNGRSRR